MGVLDEVEIERLGGDVGGDPVRPACRAVGKDHADRPVLFHDHFADLRFGLDFDAERQGFRPHRLGDGAHAADRVSPCAAYAVEFAEGMVQQPVGRAGRVGRGEIADHGVEGEGGLEVFVLEPRIEQIANGLEEDVGQVPSPRHGQSLGVHGGQSGVQQVTQAAADVGRRAVHLPTDDAADLPDHGPESR